MNTGFTFRDLIVWQKAMALCKEIYRLTTTFPAVERFGLTSQMRRAAVSIPSNIAEGNARHTTRDFLHFLMVARGSLAELETQLILAQDVQLAPEDPTLSDQLQEVRRVLQALIESLRSKNKQ